MLHIGKAKYLETFGLIPTPSPELFILFNHADRIQEFVGHRILMAAVGVVGEDDDDFAVVTVGMERILGDQKKRVVDEVEVVVGIVVAVG